MISSSALRDMSRTSPILLGIPLKYQIWVTGAASSICPSVRGALSTSLPRRRSGRRRHLYSGRVCIFRNGIPSLCRTENPFAKQAVFFRLQRPVVDRFRFFTSPYDQERILSGEARPTHKFKIIDIQQGAYLPYYLQVLA